MSKIQVLLLYTIIIHWKTRNQGKPYRKYADISIFRFYNLKILILFNMLFLFSAFVIIAILFFLSLTNHRVHQVLQIKMFTFIYSILFVI